MTKETTFKIIILGESGVGKSGIFCRFTEDTFNVKPQPTIGADFKTKKLKVDDVEVNLAIWDTAGQERFQSLTPLLYRDAVSAILVYDVANKKSFLKLNTWLDVIRSNTDNIVLMVLGNKSDLKEEREVSEKDGINFARSINALFMETSAKDSVGVNEAFTELVRKVLQTPNLYEPIDAFSLHEPSQNSNDTGGCFFSKLCSR